MASSSTSSLSTIISSYTPFSSGKGTNSSFSSRVPFFVRTSPSRSTTYSNSIKASAEGKGSLDHLQRVGQLQQQQQTRPKPRTAQVAPIGIWDRFPMAKTLQQMMDTMDKIMVDDPLGSYNTIYSSSEAAKDSNGYSRGRTPWDIKERENDYGLRFDMPGMNKNDVKVWVEENMLVLKAEKLQHQKESGDGDEEGNNNNKEEVWPAKSFGRYSYRIALPENIEFEKIKAEVRDGVLYVTIPKASSTTKILDIDVQ